MGVERFVNLRETKNFGSDGVGYDSETHVIFLCGRTPVTSQTGLLGPDLKSGGTSSDPGKHFRRATC